MSEYSTDEINTGVPDLVARCAALESEVARLREEATRCAMSANDRTVEAMDMRRERDAKAALLRELAAAAQAYLDCVYPVSAKERANLDEVLRRVEAEAGEDEQCDAD